MCLKIFAALLLPGIWALQDLDGDDAVSFVQIKHRVIQREQSNGSSNLRQPFGAADATLQAPPEGGAFSAFYNSHTEGNGIHKWLQYFPAYERHFAKFIGKEVHIVEIGIQSGGSMDMWKSVFGSKARVYGCDINPACKSYEDERTKIFIGDQESPAFWEDFLKQVPKIDILIDDGGHSVEQQVATLGIMLPHLSENGVYLTEDVHGHDNQFWSSLQFERLTSPQGKLYTGLGRVVSSVHVYPYLLVIERAKNTAATMVRELGTNLLAFDETNLLRAAANAQPADLNLQGDQERILLGKMPARSWLFARSGDARFSYEASWNAETDAFMSKILSEFSMMHEGNCCDWTADEMQKNVDSLHIYPNLLIAQRTSGEDRLIKAPQHGTSWIPYGEE